MITLLFYIVILHQIIQGYIVTVHCNCSCFQLVAPSNPHKLFYNSNYNCNDNYYNELLLLPFIITLIITTVISLISALTVTNTVCNKSSCRSQLQNH